MKKKRKKEKVLKFAITLKKELVGFDQGSDFRIIDSRNGSSGLTF